MTIQELFKRAEELKEEMRDLADFQRVNIIDVFTDCYCSNCGSDSGKDCVCVRDD